MAALAALPEAEVVELGGIIELFGMAIHSIMGLQALGLVELVELALYASLGIVKHSLQIQVKE